MILDPIPIPIDGDHVDLLNDFILVGLELSFPPF
jgi:hypothetical protein